MSGSRLLERLRAAIRVRHYSLRTERAYEHWVRRYIRFHGNRHPRTLGAAHVAMYLSSLASERNVAASTQNQALAAILFLYREVLALDLPWMEGITRAKRPRRLPVVLTRHEVNAMLGRLEGVHALMARLMYGTGLRLMECLRLRVKDVELVRREIVVREAKGGRDRVTMFPATLVGAMTGHLAQVKTMCPSTRAPASRAAITPTTRPSSAPSRRAGRRESARPLAAGKPWALRPRFSAAAPCRSATPARRSRRAW